MMLLKNIEMANRNGEAAGEKHEDQGCNFGGWGKMKDS